jgi:transcriptional regulator with XRE-family HTH domain
MNEKADRSRLGMALRALRKKKGWTLAEVSRRTGFSIPTLSKVENDKLSLSYDKLIRVSEGFSVDIADLFVPVNSPDSRDAATGRRSVNRRGEGDLVATDNYDYRYLSTDVTRKKFIPILADVHARSIEEFGELVRHSGEEFVYVIEGEIELHSELYAPLILRTGESAYLDSNMGHAYVARGTSPCRVMAICSASESDLKEAAVKRQSNNAIKRRPRRAKSKSDPRQR